MNTAKSIIRIIILLSLFATAFICILSQPDNASTSWMKDLMISKLIGVMAAVIFIRLYPRWRKSDKWLSRYDRWCMKGIK